MAVLLEIEIGFKKEAPEDLDVVKEPLEKKLKFKTKKDKKKGKLVLLTVAAKKPELVTEEAISKILKKAGMKKDIKGVTVAS